MSNKYCFDHDWFSNNIRPLQELKANWPYLSSGPIKILEIGSFEGRSTVFFAEEYPAAQITCIDTWEGGIDHDPNNPEIDFEKARRHFDSNTHLFRDRLRVIQNTSLAGLIHLFCKGERFDLIFIDGSHTAIDVMQDLVLSYQLLNQHGVIYADDYLWGYNDTALTGSPNLNPYNTPKMAIDAFSAIYRDRLSMPALSYAGAAVFIKNF